MIPRSSGGRPRKPTDSAPASLRAGRRAFKRMLDELGTELGAEVERAVKRAVEDDTAADVFSPYGSGPAPIELREPL